ncbi:G-patch and R3H domain-containing protein C30B4.02c [Psilocybe cubensis]|uniref:Protein SQS1 n=2 Tax=Psilocybe cubensis TaxID=181762 RepID=A0A8H7Y3N4_PSICU|nr:G-patch and R3H domain-containing protein C30B4.02c [Psilocybe cubensis]KAH9484812.1 G-patch and R3H domain-containing protein C30B4.02c [Psilocybe cubensis]
MARGEGRGFRGRGGRGRGRGRGGGGDGNRGGKGRGNVIPGASYLEDELELNIRMFADAPRGSGGKTSRGKGRGGRGYGQNSGSNSGTTTPNRGRGRGRGNDMLSGSGYDSPRGRGRGTPGDQFTGGRRGQFGIGSPRGGGQGGGYGRPDTLSGLLYQERPFLRPIKFVPSVLTKVLFKEEESEELLKPGVEDVDETEQSHIPTAEQVFRVFSGGNIPRLEPEEDDEEEQEEIEEVDFNDVGKLFNPSEEVKTTTIRKSKLAETTIIHEEQFTGFYMDPKPTLTSSFNGPEPTLADQPNSIDADVDSLTKMVEDALSTTEEQPNADDVDISDLQVEAETSESIATATIPVPPHSAERYNVDMITSPSEGLVPSSADPISISPHQPQRDILVVDVPVPQVEEISTTFEETLSVSPKPDDLDKAFVPQSENIGSISIQSTQHAETIAIDVPVVNVDPVIQETPSELASQSPKLNTTATEPEPDLFCIDVQPTSVPAEMAPSGDLLPSALRNDDEDDDIIVYVAPHPRKTDIQGEGTISETPEASTSTNNAPDTSRFVPYVRSAALSATPQPVASSSSLPDVTPAPVSMSSFSFSFSKQSQTPSKGDARLVVPPVSTPRQAKVWKRKRGGVKNRMKTSFGAFGAMREEAMLHREDPRRHERRRGDSDLDWGDSDDDAGEIDEVQVGSDEFMAWKGKGKEKEIQANMEKRKAQDDDHGMDVDPDLLPGMDAMKSFVGGLLGNKAGLHTTMDDIHVEDMIRMEDEQDDEDSEDDEVSSEDESEEDALAAEEAMLISEALEFDDEFGDDISDDEDEDEDEDQTPRTSFQARLERLRNKSRSKKMQDTSFDQMEDDDEEDDDDDDMIKRNMTWADQDEDFIQEIEDIFDENEDVLTGKNRKLRKALFKSIRDGTFDDLDDFGLTPAKKRKDKIKGLPLELQEAWERDRQKKAEYKKARALARLEEAADPLSINKGGKKGRKAMRAAAALDPTITVIPNRIVDMTTLVQQIRRFIADIGGPNSMSLPPTNKETRKNIHEMALAFNLKSISKGKGDSRYTTLSKTSRTGQAVDERKVAKIVRRSGGMGARGDSFIYDKKGKGPSGAMPRHREGDEVGKAAPKLTESNIGFRLLAMMGWAEGDRIGVTGGLDAPLTAIIKTTKLGLGATK